MFNKLFSAIALIGLMLFSTLGSLALPPTLSKTNTELTVKASTGKTVIAFNFDSAFLKPADAWRCPDTVEYDIPENDPKPDNTVINGILNQEDRSWQRQHRI